MIKNQALEINESISTLIEEHFENNLNKWEEVDSNKEYAKIESGRYFMENRDDWSWKYYHINTPLKKEANFEIIATIRIEKINELGQFGIVWGFDKNREVLNRFTIGADLKRFTIMQFEKDHRKIYHRFSDKINPKHIKETNKLTITKENKYLYFKINQDIVYICHMAHFCNRGSSIGYYVEPGIKISSNFFEVKLISN